MSSANERAGNEAKVIPIGGRRSGRAKPVGTPAAPSPAHAPAPVPVPAPARSAGQAAGRSPGAAAAAAEPGPQAGPRAARPGGSPVALAPVAAPAPQAERRGQGMAESLAGAVGSALSGPLGGLAERALGKGWERRAAGGLDFLRRRLTGEYQVDEFGFDPELTEKVLLTAVRPIAEKYFRLDVRGAENLPTEGGALVVANHSGVLPWDALMTQVAIHDHTPTQRHLRMLAADLVFVLPGVNELARKAGHTLACNEDAQRLLEAGEIVGVWPEGFKGIGKPFSERYKLQRFGRGGFVSSALKAGVPIVPCSIMGAEETYPMIGNARTVARLLGLPYVPLTPTFPWLGPLGAVPLPTKWTIQFGEPIPTDDYPAEAADDPMLVFNLTDQVRETIQHTLYRLLVQRRSVFF
ncbi:acyltransferase family protein [Streptacidiphilus sp. PB12-B1b]|uniref:lysophospholipid acyltransferase family protein n=1 Tax=Streptacidiphilus sp. PB12-B1b TaxID=2705012 RepID=UPI0015FCE192|nr:lysophospholipid acyltransferase family protein [Streptacidiphilus sp. PB12-B1b]QMU79522.1 acyltransferase family protein [Streptacidiphilus sp. PB12-B1b]